MLDWYSQNRPNHGGKILDEFDVSLKYISTNPFKCQIRYDDVRVYLLKKYKFAIHYTTDEDIIYVLGFFHQHQDSDNWKEQ